MKHLFKFTILSLLVLILSVSCSKSSAIKQLNLNRVHGIRGSLAPLVKGNKVTFRIQAKNATFVTIAGSFNGWNPRVTPLNKGTNDIWSITIPLKKRRTYLYKFAVDGFWVADPDNPDTEPDGFGGVNSKIKVIGDQK